MEFNVKIETEVVLPENKKKETAKLRLELGNDVVTFYLDGKEIFMGDWEANFKQIFKQAMLSFENVMDEQ